MTQFPLIALAVFCISTTEARARRWHPPLVYHAPDGKPRDQEQRHYFLCLTNHPHGWPGHVVDHLVPLKRGGLDKWWNMQWQKTEEAKEKDRWE